MSESTDLTIAEARDVLGIDDSRLDGEITMALNSAIASFSVSVGDPELINRYSDLVSLKKEIESLMVYRDIKHDYTLEDSINYKTHQLQCYASKKKLEEDIANGIV